ncbi:MAG: hypothetical protein J6S23_05865 [Clostridia bacterium]|nr:hypothetical protein [Clostridia bacterium]
MSESTEKTSETANPTQLISALLSNPETLSKLSGILSKFTTGENITNSPPQNTLEANVDNKGADNNEIINANSDISPTEPISSNSNSNIDFSKIAPIFSMLNAPSKAKNNRQIALLLAIKPYLSPRRKELIDSFIKITNFSEILKNINQQGDSDVPQ